LYEYLAYSINTNIREIEGALNTLLAQASLNKKAITLELAKQMVDKFVRSTAREVSIEYIQKVVCDYFDLPIEMLKSKTGSVKCSSKTNFNVFLKEDDKIFTCKYRRSLWWKRPCYRSSCLPNCC
jgi:ATPase involved in DNA replication initiation